MPLASKGSFIKSDVNFQEAEKFHTQLDGLEQEICNTNVELKELRAMNDDAVISKDAAQSELVRHEKVLYEERKQREIELNKMKEEAENKKLQHERIERRIVRLFFFFINIMFKYKIKEGVLTK